MMAKRKASYSVSEIAALLHWSRKKVRRWIQENGIRTIRVGKRKIEVPLSELFGENMGLIETGLVLGEQYEDENG